MDAAAFAQSLRDNLPYAPNAQQTALIDVLARFCTVPVDGQERAFILNGYAGTGKTSLTGALVKVLRDAKRPFMLLAPTGRAAKVLSTNAGGLKAYTIHRKIYRHDPFGGAGWQRGEHTPADNKLQNSVFIVDEASMIAAADERGENLLEDLLAYVFGNPGNSLILIGDTAQLPPVGSDRSPAMNPDVLRRYGIKVTHAVLTETARQSADSGILFNATRLRRIMAKIKALPEGSLLPVPKLRERGFDDVAAVEGTDLPEAIYDAYSEGINDTILITRSNRRAAEYNAAIRSQVLYRESEIEVDDMLIVSRNHYFQKKVEGLDFVANGDIVTVVKIYGIEAMHGLRFADIRVAAPAADGEGEDVEFDCKIILDTLNSAEASLSQESWNTLYYSLMAGDGPYGAIPADRRPGALRSDPYWNAVHVKYAYAITCHKAQGGQWNNVFVDLSYIPEDALGQNLYRWLYTAVTRARRKLYLIEPPEALMSGVRKEE